MIYYRDIKKKSLNHIGATVNNESKISFSTSVNTNFNLGSIIKKLHLSKKERKIYPVRLCYEAREWVTALSYAHSISVLVSACVGHVSAR